MHKNIKKKRYTIVNKEKKLNNFNLFLRKQGLITKKTA